MRTIFLAICSCLLLASFNHQAVDAVAIIDIETMDLETLEKTKKNPAFSWWSELGDSLVVGGVHKKLLESGLDFQNMWSQLLAEDLVLVVAGHRHELPAGMKLIAQSGRIMLATQGQGLQSNDHMKVMKFEKNKTYVQSSTHSRKQHSLDTEQSSIVKAIMDEVDVVRWYGDVATLTNWNRHISSVDIVSARDWFKSQFESLNPASVTLQKFSVSGRDAWNVVATFNPTEAGDIYVVGGHYDSISEQTSRAAPGAEDNASGSAGVLEMARVFASRKTSATFIFIVFSGEEQGLWGSKAYVRSLPTNVKSRIKAVINMDMIGYSTDDSEDVLLETSRDFKHLTDQFATAASLVPGLRYFTTFNPFGSDHMPFIDNGIPAILTIDNDWGSYPSYHRTTDTIDKISREMGAAILKMNVAALAVMAGAE